MINKHNINNYHHGFTLIELIAVIIIISILSLYISNNKWNRADYYPHLYQEQLISILRNVQASSMQDNKNIRENKCNIIYIKNDYFGIDRSCYKKETPNTVLLDLSNENKPEELKSIEITHDLGYENIMLSFDFMGKPIIITDSSVNRICSNNDCTLTVLIKETNERKSICINGEGYLYRPLNSSECH